MYVGTVDARDDFIGCSNTPVGNFLNTFFRALSRVGNVDSVGEHGGGVEVPKMCTCIPPGGKYFIDH